MKNFILIIVAMVTAMFAGIGGGSGPHHLFTGVETLPLMFGLVNESVLTSIYNSFKTIFNKAFDAIKESELLALAMQVPSSTRQETYGWLGNIPGMREWIGDRAVRKLAVDGYVIKNKDFEATVAVDRNDIEDDTLGIYRPMFEMLAQSSKSHPAELIGEVLKAGETTLCFDKTNFFNTSHPNGAQPVFSNLLAGSALNAANFETARQTMMEYVNDQDRSLEIVPTHLVVPPALEKAGKDILMAERLANGATNTNKGAAELVVAPGLSSKPTEWYLACLNKAVKPLVLQTRKTPEFVALTNSTDVNVFMRKEFIYGVDDRKNVGFGLPHLLLKGKA